MLVVQKYGGSSVASAERILHVAGRIAARIESGANVVAVVSAMGDTTDDLLALAFSITEDPSPRELDMHLSFPFLEHQAGTVAAGSGNPSGVGGGSPNTKK